jgi:hypothetical protein
VFISYPDCLLGTKQNRWIQTKSDKHFRFLKINFNILLHWTPGCPRGVFSFTRSNLNFVCISCIAYACCVLRVLPIPSSVTGTLRVVLCSAQTCHKFWGISLFHFLDLCYTCKKGEVVIPWRRMGELRYSSTILDLGTRWRWVVSFMPRPLYPRYPLDRRLGGPKSRSGRRVLININSLLCGNLFPFHDVRTEMLSTKIKV